MVLYCYDYKGIVTKNAAPPFSVSHKNTPSDHMSRLEHLNGYTRGGAYMTDRSIEHKDTSWPVLVVHIICFFVLFRACGATETGVSLS